MTSHPNCKINLGLQVVSRRPDGYHNLQTIFLPVPLCDSLDISPSDDFSFSQDGIPVDCPDDQNICVKAYRLLKSEFPQLPPVHIRLSKHIPFGAGLGGGSSDAAQTLVSINSLFDLGLSNDELCRLSARIGSDCPFFILNQPAYATGTGDCLEPIEFQFPIPSLHFVLLKPPISVSTADAYRNIVPKPSPIDLRQAILQPMSEWRDLIMNDFENPVFRLYPVLADLKQALYDHGAVYASMSGSGSAIFAFFKDLPADPLPCEIYRLPASNHTL